MPRYPALPNHTPTRCFHADYAGAQTGEVIVTPTPGFKLKVYGVYASSKVTNVDVTLAFGTSGAVLFKLYTANRATATGNILCAYGGVDETIKLTCGAGCFISIGYEETK